MADFLTFARQNARWLGAGALLMFLSSFGQTFFISLFAGEIRAEFGLSHGAWGGIYALGTTASAVVMVWSGALTDRFRVRALGPMVLTGLALACLSMALAPGAWALPLVVFLLRLFGQGMSTHTAAVAMSRWFTATRGRALSIATLGFSAGEALLPLIFVSLLVWVDWQVLWMLCAGIAVLGIPLLVRLLRQERTPQSIAESHASLGMQGRHWTRIQTLRHPLFWFMVPAILGPSAFGTAFFFHQVHYAEIKGWTHLELVALFPIYTGAAVAAMMGYGWALDRFGTVRLITSYQLPFVAAFILFSTCATPLGALAGLLCMALAVGGNVTLPNAVWAEFFGTRHIGAIKASAAAAMVLGSAIGPAITGWGIDRGVGLETQYLFVALYYLLTTLSLWIGIRRYARDLPGSI